MDLDIIFEDKDIIVLNKSKGVVVHPGGKFRKYSRKCFNI